jgi:hypothetical protein
MNFIKKGILFICAVSLCLACSNPSSKKINSKVIDTNDEQSNPKQAVKTYIQKVISFPENVNENIGKVILSADTLVPNYYIEYNKNKYRIDSHLYHQRGINFSYDIFENKQVSKSFYGSFILFYGEPLDVFQEKTEDGLYHYTTFNISINKQLLPSNYYEIYEFGTANLSQIDTIASLKKVRIKHSSIEKYFSKDNAFPSLNGVKEVNYLLRNGHWTLKLTDEEENLIKKHFVNYISK